MNKVDKEIDERGVDNDGNNIGEGSTMNCKPRISMLFDSDEEAYTFYTHRALHSHPKHPFHEAMRFELFNNTFQLFIYIIQYSLLVSNLLLLLF